jgi:hypothetical protein
MRVPLPETEQGILEVRLRNQRLEGKWGHWVSAFVTADDTPGEYRIVAIQRED